MSLQTATSTIYRQLKAAQERRGATQTALASQLGVPQPRLSELEGRLRSGNVSKQMALLLATAEALGLVAVLVPQEAMEQVETAIQDYEITHRSPLPVR